MRNEAMGQLDVLIGIVADDVAERVVPGAGQPGGAGLGHSGGNGLSGRRVSSPSGFSC
ncbi:hypothetical protein ACFVYA_49790 [Amycolatopsis sp. NPDC058278]|uniref:hypothetical protein n=1 Tax=Amycolatopsis sp. NPDC058278 TaxID=3346417 RepID=UPI0036DE750E